MSKTIYLDHAATTPVKEEVLKEMLPYFKLNFGNASALYTIGRASKRAIDFSRARVARLIGAKPNEIFFTSCGSESDNLAIKGIAYKNKSKGKHIITSKVEHPAVLNTCKTLEEEGFEVTYLNVDKYGVVSTYELERSIRKTTILISIMMANNEVGSIQPIKEIGQIARKHNILFHTDGVQAIGNIKIDVNDMNIDLLSMSGHKFYAPKGVGALFVRDGTELKRIQDGGHQEKGKRAGTENVAGIVGIGKAAEIAYDNLDAYNKHLISLRDYCIEKIGSEFPNAKLNGHKIKRLPGNCNFSFPGIDSTELLFKLDEKGIYTSVGSACSSGEFTPSHVLLAMGVDSELTNGTIRITFGDDNSKSDVDILVENLKKIIKK